MKFNIKNFSNFGFYAYAAFIICVVSGIVLSAGFDISAPFVSLSSDYVNNRFALIARSAHYWSANLFLIMIIIHIFYHFVTHSYEKTKKAVWIRLSLLILIIMYAMLSGFILRGGLDSIQARNILTGLIESIPLAGKSLSQLLLGNENSFVLIFVHHISTATILIWLSAKEHGKVFQPGFVHYLKVLAVTIPITLLFIPGLHDPMDTVTKSPWYFLGMQEILHWINYPLIVITLTAAFIYIIIILRNAKETLGKVLKRFILFGFILYVCLSVFAFVFRGAGWNIYNPFYQATQIDFALRPPGELFYSNFDADTTKGIPFNLGRLETCMICHSGMEGFSASHDPQSIGCSSCHLGDNMAVNKDLAHKGMILVPGNLADAEKTCGQTDCHVDISRNVHTSIMATMSGVVSVDKWVFGETGNRDSLCNVMQLGHSPAETHLRNLCVSCHLQNKKTEPAPITELSRGGGCTACHVDYNGQAVKQWETYKADKAKFPSLHPQLNIASDNERCFGCHSRSGRISLNYEGWVETLYNKDNVPDTIKYRILQDGRVFRYLAPDVHHESGMLCTDCHSAYEIMGDGRTYAHKEQAVKVTCGDCHSEHIDNTVRGSELDYVYARIAELKNVLSPDKRYIATKQDRLPLLNTFLKNRNAWFILHDNSDTLEMKTPPEICGRDIPGHSRLSCEACHSSWATSCVGCHNYYDNNVTGWDYLENEETRGSWIEEAENVEPYAPALGIRKDKDGNEKIIGFMPGMVLTIDKQKPKQHRDFARIYSPVFSHTIGKSSRTCKSCHNDPFALGYGRGELTYTVANGKSECKFKPYYEKNVHDILPEDAWVDFLKPSPGSGATRTEVRPFTVEEQKKILLVGACFSCHKESDEKLIRYFRKNKYYLRGISKQCILPFNLHNIITSSENN